LQISGVLTISGFGCKGPLFSAFTAPKDVGKSEETSLLYEESGEGRELRREAAAKTAVPCEDSG